MLGPVKVKGFLDCLGDGYIVDSKSTKSVSKFRYSVRDFCYDIQAYIYTKVFGVNEFYWLVQEKTAPYLPAIVECSEETLFAGEMKFNDAIERIEKFLREGSSPFKITFDSKYKWLPYLICGFRLLSCILRSLNCLCNYNPINPLPITQ